MSVVRLHEVTQKEVFSFETEQKKNGKPMLRVVCEFINNKPKFVFDDGPNAEVMFNVSGRKSMETWFCTVQELMDLRDAVDEAVHKIAPFLPSTLKEVQQ